jgi:hypothetical protein
MLLSPIAHALDVRGAAEVIPVLGFAQPETLTLGLAGLAAFGLGTEPLMPTVASVSHEQLPAMQTFTLIRFEHQAMVNGGWTGK